MRILICITFFIFQGLSGYGQESKKYLKLKANYNYREGYIITLDSTREEGLIKDYLREVKKYSVVTFVNKKGAKNKYYPNEIRGYGYAFYRFVSSKSSFFEIVKSGNRVSLYKNISVSSWSVPGAPGMAPMTYTSQGESFFVKKPGENTFKWVRKKNSIKRFPLILAIVNRLRNRYWRSN